MGKRRNQKGNQNKPKWKYNIPKPRGCNKSSPKREVYNINTCIKKK